MINFKSLLPGVSTFVFDVDGVLTDGTVTLMPDGSLVRVMNTRDGFALQLAVKKGLRVVIITGGKSPDVKTRLEKLGIKDVYLGVSDKKELLSDYITENNLDPNSILYMGDDIPDYASLKICGVPTCPNDASPDIKAICTYISEHKGGKGCARDVIEQVLRSKGMWEPETDGKL